MATTFPLKMLAFLVLLAALTHAFNYGVDPLQIYRKQEQLEPLFSEQQRLQVPGLTRHYSNSATRLIVGSSMTANFRSSDVDNLLGGHTIKLSINGSTAYEQHFVLNQALSTSNSRRQINSVLWGIDLGSFNENYGEFSQETGAYPLHLYRDDIALLKYTLSLQTTLHSLRTLISTFLGYSFPLESQDIDTLNTWNRTTGCGPVLQHLDTITKQSSFLENQGFTFRRDVFSKHIDDFVDTAKSNPDIEFIAFYSPYSIVRYKRLEQIGGVEHFLKLREEFYKGVRGVENIKVIDIQAEKDVIANLNYYKDVGHFDRRVNQMLLQRILGRQFNSEEEVSANSILLKQLIHDTSIDDIRSACSERK